MNQDHILKIIISPYISDKSYRISEKLNIVVFKVAKNSNKCEIKYAIEKLFQVKVLFVNIVNIKGTSKIVGRIKGRTKDWKKAYIKLAKGYEINFSNE